MVFLFPLVWYYCKDTKQVKRAENKPSGWVYAQQPQGREPSSIPPCPMVAAIGTGAGCAVNVSH